MHRGAEGDLNASNQDQWTPLHAAVKANQVEAVEYLLQNKASDGFKCTRNLGFWKIHRAKTRKNVHFWAGLFALKTKCNIF